MLSLGRLPAGGQLGQFQAVFQLPNLSLLRQAGALYHGVLDDLDPPLVSLSFHDGEVDDPESLHRGAGPQVLENAFGHSVYATGRVVVSVHQAGEGVVRHGLDLGQDGRSCSGIQRRQRIGMPCDRLHAGHFELDGHP